MLSHARTPSAPPASAPCDAEPRAASDPGSAENPPGSRKKMVCAIPPVKPRRPPDTATFGPDSCAIAEGPGRTRRGSSSTDRPRRARPHLSLETLSSAWPTDLIHPTASTPRPPPCGRRPALLPVTAPPHGRGAARTARPPWSPTPRPTRSSARTRPVTTSNGGTDSSARSSSSAIDPERGRPKGRRRGNAAIAAPRAPKLDPPPVYCPAGGAVCGSV